MIRLNKIFGNDDISAELDSVLYNSDINIKMEKIEKRKFLSNFSQILVKFQSNFGQILVKFW